MACELFCCQSQCSARGGSSNRTDDVVASQVLDILPELLYALNERVIVISDKHPLARILGFQKNAISGMERSAAGVPGLISTIQDTKRILTCQVAETICRT